MKTRTMLGATVAAVALACSPSTILESATLPSVDSGTLLVHLKADAGVTSDETGVSLWQDQSSNGYEFIPMTEFLPLVETGLTGNQVLRFNGDALLKSTLSMQLFPESTSGLSIFVAFSSINVAGQKFLVNWGIADPDTGNRGNVELGSDAGALGAGNFGVHYGCGQASATQPNTIANNQFVIMSTLIKSAGEPPANVAIYKNGIAQLMVAGGPGGCPPNHAGWLAPGEYLTGEAPLDIGARDDTGRGSLGAYHNGDIGEVLIYRGTLSDDDRTAVEQYLGARYGIDTTPIPVELVDERCVKIRYSSSAFEFALEGSSSLSPAGWSAVTNQPVRVGDSMEVIIPRDGTMYYRLHKP